MPATLAVITQRNDPQKSSHLASVAFETAFGWMALQFQGDLLAALRFGLANRRGALAALPTPALAEKPNASQQEIQQRLVAFASGQPVDLTEIEVVPQWDTPFACRVVEACRNIPYGETLSYAEVATIAGSPGAARAVGNVMSSNMVPLVIPCHRVIGAHGALGGYSARGGIAVKRRLLDLEASAISRQTATAR